MLSVSVAENELSVEETGSSVFDVSMVEEGLEDFELLDDFDDFSELEEVSEILVVLITEVVETKKFSVDVLDETKPICSLTVVDEIVGSFSTDDCGTLDCSLEKISDCAELLSELSDDTGGSVFISTDAEELDRDDSVL